MMVSCLLTAFAVLPLLSSVCIADQSQIVFSSDEPSQRPHRIAIIGGGAGGSSAAYHLRKFVDASAYDLPLVIDIFEAQDRIGGRTTTVNALNDTRYPVEVGASIFVDKNYILANATKEFGLRVSTNLYEVAEESRFDLGVWNGREFVFKQSSGSSWWQGYWDIAKLLWKYGTSPIRTRSLTQRVVGAFLDLYDSAFPFSMLQDAIEGAGLLKYTAATGYEVLRAEGISEAFARDIVQASTRVNYATNLNQIHGLEALVCMATDGAMAVEGGNWQIFDEAVKRSNANVKLNTTVKGIMKKGVGQYYLALDNQASAIPEPYQNVILAAPYQFSGLEIEPEPAYLPESIDYVTLYVTLFTSPYMLSPTFFDMAPEQWQDVPATILTTLPSDFDSTVPDPHIFKSISTLQVIADPNSQSPQYLYKIFSSAKLTGTFISELYGFQDSYSNTSESDPVSDIPNEHITWLHEKTWQSYPVETPRSRFEYIRLDPDISAPLGTGLWYTSGIEPFVSTMETSALMGMNIARLIVDELEWIEEHADEQEHPEYTGRSP
jgi:prenylcysteine oxidase / farnesylcysteine lyase